MSTHVEVTCRDCGCRWLTASLWKPYHPLVADCPGVRALYRGDVS